MSTLDVELPSPIQPPQPEPISKVEVTRITIIPSRNTMRLSIDVGDKAHILSVEDEEYAAVITQVDIPSLVTILMPAIQAKIAELG